MKVGKRDEIKGFEMCVWRRLEKIIWVDGVSNEEVLNRRKGGRTLLNTVLKRMGNCIGHVIGRKGVLTIIFEGTVEG